MKAGRSAEEWEDFASALAFLGNSMLMPMSMTAPVGLESEFWAAFSRFDDGAVTSAASELCAWIANRSSTPTEQLVRDVSIEYTRLFVGPPAPLAPPWETMNGTVKTNVGFGEATFQMKRLLREAGLAFVGQNRQYEDHIGIELLYASELARRAVVGEGEAYLSIGEASRESSASPTATEQLRAFLAEHPLRWIGVLKGRVAEAAPDGYYLHLLRLTEALMQAL